MGFQIEDGTGHSFHAEVTKDKKLAVSAVMKSDMVNISEAKGEAYIAETNFTTTSTNQVFFYLKNDDSSKQLNIHTIIMNTDTNTMMHLHKATGTPVGGNEVIATNLNFTKGNTAKVIILGAGSITGLALIKLHHARILASDTFSIQWGGSIILGFGDAIAIQNINTGQFSTCSVQFFMD